MTRPYKSDVRDERAQQTRRALLDACEQLLLELPIEEVTLPAVARRAGVSKPTAYSHFADNDALMEGFVDRMRDRIGTDHQTLPRIPPSELPNAVRDNYARYEANERLLLRMMDSPSYNRVRLARKVDRPGLALPAWSEAGAKGSLREHLGPIYLLSSPSSWRWLRETWGLSPAEAAKAAAWAMEVLVEAVEKSRQPTKGGTRPARRPARTPSAR